MRMFVKNCISARDFEFGFRCQGRGGGDRHPVHKIETRHYSFENINRGKAFLGLSIDLPYLELCPLVDGVRIISKYFGKTYGKFEEPPLKRCMRVKDAFSFSGSDFEYIQYIASALASAESYNRPFRALVLTEELYFVQAALHIPQEARRNEVGKIILWDTEDRYAKFEAPRI
jgi:hypothetical protein